MKRPLAEDILNFLTKNRYNAELSDVQSLIKMYDSDQDGALHNYELRRLMLSLTDPTHRDRFTKMPLVQPVGDMHSLGAGAVQQLARLIMSEVHGLRFLERDRTYLIVGRNLTSVIAYSLLKDSEKNEVEREDIARFLEGNGYAPSDEDIEGIFWRLDHNKDGKLTYSDFC
jgi:Ca2+-binding EF-hand superfamily protein